MKYPKNHKKRALYDLTYGTRGVSGIPGDARSVAQVLMEIFQEECDILLFPKSYVRRTRKKSLSAPNLAPFLGAALKNNLGRSLLPNRVSQALIILQSKSFFRKVRLLKVISIIKEYALSNLGVTTSSTFTGNLFVASIGNSTRFARSPKRKNFKLDTSGYDFFVQQQIDPISVSKETKHIVRLHDILPITHPQYFDQLAIQLFGRGLDSLLKNQKIIWVFDSETSASQFQEIFGSHRIVTHIPCAVGSHFSSIPQNIVKTENRISVVNTIEPRKNVSHVIQEFKVAKGRGLIPNDYKLSILGSQGWQDESLHSDLLNEKFGVDVEFIQAPSNEVVAQYLEKSRLVVSASFAEGFGLPPLEGMLFGCVPVISDIPQHRETVGANGFYFNNQDDSLRYVLKEAHEKSTKLKSEDLLALQEHVVAKYGSKNIMHVWQKLFDSL